jgi:tetratricopeptide (TPR) repeat protein
MKKNLLLLLLGLFAGLLISKNSIAQDEPRFGKDSVTCITNNSLYYEFYKQWKQSNYKNEAWKDVITPWTWVFNNCPRSYKNVYIHGEKLVKKLIKTETDKEKKDKYIDTLMMLFDQRIKYFGQEGYVLGKKGVDLYKYRPTDYEKSYEILKKAINLTGNKTQGPVLIYYFRSAEKMVKAGKLDKSVLLDIYDQESDIIDYNIKNDPKKAANWEIVKGNIELSVEPYTTCDDLVNIYTPKFNESSDSIELLKKITKILDKKGCTDTELYRLATENLHKLEPSARSAELLAKMYIKKENWTKALDYLKQATELQEDPNKKADLFYMTAVVYFQLKKYSQARANCYDVLKFRPNDGKAYILIGNMYAASAKSCGNNDLTNKVAYWAAVDKFIKAKNVDPSVADEAKKLINTYSQYFPATETIFFYDLKKGDKYKVGCWINETTTVRTSD